MKYLAIILIFIFVLNSGEFVSESIIKKAEQKYGRFAKNRFIALQNTLNNLENKSELEKIEAVNDFFNQVKYSKDINTYGVTDYWATPYEFLGRDKGDCEDYVIAKYFALKHLGVSTKKLFLTYVRVVGYDDAHMVLTYFATPTSEPLVLDNMRTKVFPASQRKDLKPVFNFNPDILKDGKKTTAHRKWDELLKNMRENKL